MNSATPANSYLVSITGSGTRVDTKVIAANPVIAIVRALRTHVSDDESAQMPQLLVHCKRDESHAP